MMLSTLFLAAALVTVEDRPPTHEQIATIDVDGTLQCFALAVDGRVLAGCGGISTPWGKAPGEDGPKGEIRVYDAEGNLAETWPCAVAPEAISVDKLGLIYIAGDGELVKLDAKGKLLHRGPAPHAAALEEGRAALEEQARAQIEASQKAFTGQIDEAKKTIERVGKKPEAERTAAEKAELAQQEQMLQILEDYLSQNTGDVSAQVQAMSGQKLKASSIAVSAEHVYLTTQALKGYTYDVWRTDHDFANAERIVEGLSGCCGQMDVQCDGDSLFVAENGRHRVSRYDNTGRKLAHWGQGDRTGKAGFQGCCNPMNLAFDRVGVVYAAESEGRILRYAANGQALGEVGTVALQPGCKNVSLKVTDDGKRVYMIDIVRHKISVLQKKDSSIGGGG